MHYDSNSERLTKLLPEPRRACRRTPQYITHIYSQSWKKTRPLPESRRVSFATPDLYRFPSSGQNGAGSFEAIAGRCCSAATPYFAATIGRIRPVPCHTLLGHIICNIMTAHGSR
jgi:hypothetical protein